MQWDALCIVCKCGRLRLWRALCNLAMENVKTVAAHRRDLHRAHVCASACVQGRGGGEGARERAVPSDAIQTGKGKGSSRKEKETHGTALRLTGLQR